MPARSPLVLGHEGAGVVVRRGAEVTAIEIGDRVAWDPRVGAPWEAGRRLGVDIDGVFASHVLLPQASLFRVPVGVRLKDAAYLEPLAAAFGVLEVDLGEGPGVIWGDNRIGRLTAAVLAGHGRPVPCVTEVSSVAPGSLGFAIEAEACARDFDALLHALRPGGVLVLKSRSPTPATFPVHMLVEKHLRVVGIAYGSFERALAWMAEGRIDVSARWGAAFPLTAFETAFARARDDERTKTAFAIDPALDDGGGLCAVSSRG